MIQTQNKEKLQKSNFEKDFLKEMKNAFFRRTIENMRKHRDIKIVTTGARRTYLVSKLNYYKTNIFLCEKLLAIKMKITQILMNKPVYLDLSISRSQ